MGSKGMIGQRCAWWEFAAAICACAVSNPQLQETEARGGPLQLEAPSVQNLKAQEGQLARLVGQVHRIEDGISARRPGAQDKLRASIESTSARTKRIEQLNEMKARQQWRKMPSGIQPLPPKAQAPPVKAWNVHMKVVPTGVQQLENKVWQTQKPEVEMMVQMEVGGVCGDGQRDAGEACDDGNKDADDKKVGGKGCSADCKTVESGYKCTKAIADNADKCSPVCGDSKRMPGEACDDGNTAAGDGCDPQCNVEDDYACQGGSPTAKDACAKVACGNGFRSSGEKC